jgi:transcriptional regulator with XRE-family HTH domain
MEVGCMLFIERLIYLMNKRSVTKYRLSKDIGISDSLISKWQRNTATEPSASILYKLSEYFQVSMEWLLVGKENTPSRDNNTADNEPVSLDADELELISNFRRLPARQQGRLVERSKAMTEIDEESEERDSPLLGRAPHGVKKKTEHHPRPRSGDSAELGPGDDFNVSAG